MRLGLTVSATAPVQACGRRNVRITPAIVLEIIAWTIEAEDPQIRQVETRSKDAEDGFQGRRDLGRGKRRSTGVARHRSEPAGQQPCVSSLRIRHTDPEDELPTFAFRAVTTKRSVVLV